MASISIQNFLVSALLFVSMVSGATVYGNDPYRQSTLAPYDSTKQNERGFNHGKYGDMNAFDSTNPFDVSLTYSHGSSKLPSRLYADQDSVNMMEVDEHTRMEQQESEKSMERSRNEYSNAGYTQLSDSGDLTDMERSNYEEEHEVERSRKEENLLETSSSVLGRQEKGLDYYPETMAALNYETQPVAGRMQYMENENENTNQNYERQHSESISSGSNLKVHGAQGHRQHRANTDWFNRAYQILHSQALNFRPLRFLLSKIFTFLDRNISDAELLANILRVLPNKSNSMFSSFIHKLFDYEFYNEYNLLYYLFGIKGTQPIKFNIMNYIRKEFPHINWSGANTLHEMIENSESTSQTQNWMHEESHSKNLYQRVNNVLLNNKLNLNNLRLILNKVIPSKKCDISDGQLLSDLLDVFQYKTDSIFSSIINKLFNHRFDNEYNALYYILGIKGNKPERISITDFMTDEFYKSVTERSDNYMVSRKENNNNNNLIDGTPVFNSDVINSNRYNDVSETNSWSSQEKNIVSHNSNNAFVVNNRTVDTPVFNSDVIHGNNDVSETNNWVSREENIMSHKSNSAFEKQFVANNDVVEIPVTDADLINYNEYNNVSETKNFVSQEENIITHNTNNEFEQKFVINNQLADTPVINIPVINNDVSETTNWVSQEENFVSKSKNEFGQYASNNRIVERPSDMVNNAAYDDFSQINKFVTQKENTMTQNSKEFEQEVLVNNQIRDQSDVVNNGYGYVSENQNSVSEKEKKISKSHHSFRRVNDILHRNKLNFNTLRTYLNRFIPYMEWDMTDNQLLDNILHVLRYKPKSDFSILINKVYNHKLYNEYNALYYLLGIKPVQPVVFNMADFIRNQFNKNTEFSTIASHWLQRAYSVLKSQTLNFNILRAILRKMSIYELVKKSDNQLLSAILRGLQKHDGSKFLALIRHLFNHELYKGYNALYHILGIKGNSKVDFNVWDFLRKSFPFSRLGRKILNISDDFAGCQLFKILKKTFPAIDETYISKIVLNTVVDYMRQNNLYSQRTKQQPMWITSQND